MTADLPSPPAPSADPAAARAARLAHALRQVTGRRLRIQRIRRYTLAILVVLLAGGGLLVSHYRRHAMGSAYLRMLQATVDYQLDATNWRQGGSTKVFLNGRFFSPARDSDLSHLADLHRVEELDLGANSMITDNGLSHLKSLRHLKVLTLIRKPTSFVLGANGNITDAGLASIRDLTEMRELDISGCQLTDDGMSHLERMTKLEVLKLSGTQIGDAGLKSLAGMTRLRTLDLSQTEVGDAGLSHLAGLTSLEDLNLDRTQVGDGAIPRLVALPKLGRVSLDGTDLTLAGWTALLAARPQMEVVVDTKLGDLIDGKPNTYRYNEPETDVKADPE